MKKTAAKGHTRKHAGTRKHQHTTKHHPVHQHPGASAHGAKVHTVAKHPKHAKARGLVLAGSVAWCVAEALAESLRLAGHVVTGADILALHRLAGASDEDGAQVLDVLETAAESGLAGVPLARFAEQPLDQLPLPCRQLARHRLEPDLGEIDHGIGEGLIHGLILGVELPGPHTVLATPQGWWSWGELYHPATWPDAVIEEAWAVTWS